jgi:hypothetical protein
VADASAGATDEGALVLESQTRVRAGQDDVVDRVVAELNSIQSRATLDLALKMGALIIERVYGGDLSSWRQHRAKEASFRKLAARSRRDLRVSPTFLYRAVALYELTCRLGESALAGLKMTHLRVVLGLPEQSQAALLGAAAAEGWSADRLEREAVGVRALLITRRGRPRSSPLVKAVNRFLTSWKRVQASLDPDAAGDLSAREIQSICVTMSEITERLEQVGRRGTAAPRHRLMDAGKSGGDLDPGPV